MAGSKVQKTLKVEIREVLSSYDVSMEKPSAYKMAKICLKLLGIFERCADPRVKGRCSYRLADLILMIFLARLSGADTIGEICIFWDSEIRVYKRIFKHEAVPSHDTFRRILSLIEPTAINEVLVDAVKLRDEAIRKALNIPKPERTQVMMDGKVMRGTRRKAGTDEEVKAIQILNAMEYDSETCIASIAIDKKTNEIPHVRELIANVIDTKDKIITFDSLHTNIETVRLIMAKNKPGHRTDFVGGLKGNQPKLNEFAKNRITDGYMKEVEGDDNLYFNTTEISHNQLEDRQFYMYKLKDIEKRGLFLEWPNGVNTITCVKKTIRHNVTGKESVEIRNYLSSLDDVRLIADVIRSHWAIENNLHWELDTVMNEDQCSLTNRAAATNWSIINKICLSFLKRYQELLGKKAPSKKGLRKMLGWNFREILGRILLLMDAEELSSSLILSQKEK